MNYVAIRECSLKLSCSAGEVDFDTYVETITTIPSKNVKIHDSGVFSNSLDVVIGAGTLNSKALAYPILNFSIKPTATKIKADGGFVLRKNDKATISTNVTNVQTGASIPAVFTLEITDAGQTKIKCK